MSIPRIFQLLMKKTEPIVLTDKKFTIATDPIQVLNQIPDLF